MAGQIRDIIVVGASAGGVEVLSRLVAGLPADLPAAVFVVLHLRPNVPSHLPEILSRRGPLPAQQAEHGDAIRPGRILVAPPDHHLIIRRDRVELSHGPRENMTRPAIDPSFRSAARAFGPRVAGVVLSGTLGDGAAGLLAIKARGGTTIAQDPDEALFSEMPTEAIRQVGPDHVLAVGAIAALIDRLAREPIPSGAPPMSSSFEDAPEVIHRDLQAQSEGRKRDEPSTVTCPECGGTLWQFREDNVTQFRCHVGHIYAPEALLVDLSEELEAALWRCVRMLTEKATLARQLAVTARANGRPESAERFEDQALLEERHHRLIRETLLEGVPGRCPDVEDDGDPGPDRGPLDLQG